MKSTLLLLIVLTVSTTLTAQHTIKIGTQVPIQYAIQYDYKLSKRFSTNAQVGVLTKPYDQAILSILEAFGVSQEIVDVLTYSFDFGIISQVGANYHFRKNYVGATGSWIHLRASDTPVGVIESAYNVDVNSYPTRPKQNASSPVTLTLASDLFTVGVVYGRRFTFKNPRIELHTELSFAKVIASKSYLESPQRSLENLSALVDEELNGDYLTYGYLPSINILFAYKLSKN